MKKYLKYGLIAVAVIGVAAVVFAGRNITKNVETVDQSNKPVPTAIKSDSKTLRSGTFSDADSVHNGSGTATVIQTGDGQVVKFENFDVTKGPDLFVYLTKNNFEDDKGEGEFVSLGKLQSTSGEQIYKLPDNAGDYTSVIVWCRAFNTAFTGAVLK